MADNQFAEFDNMDYHDNQMTTCLDQMLETGRNLGMTDIEVDTAMETDFENVNPSLKLYYAMHKIHSLMFYYLNEMRRTNGIGNNRQHLFEIRHMLTVYNDIIPLEFDNRVRLWTQYRLDTFHYDWAH